MLNNQNQLNNKHANLHRNWRDFICRKRVMGQALSHISSWFSTYVILTDVERSREWRFLKGSNGLMGIGAGNLSWSHHMSPHLGLAGRILGFGRLCQQYYIWSLIAASKSHKMISLYVNVNNVKHICMFFPSYIIPPEPLNEPFNGHYGQSVRCSLVVANQVLKHWLWKTQEIPQCCPWLANFLRPTWGGNIQLATSNWVNWMVGHKPLLFIDYQLGPTSEWWFAKEYDFSSSLVQCQASGNVVATTFHPPR